MSAAQIKPIPMFIGLLAAGIVLLDQFTKFLVLRVLPYGDEMDLLPGFFKLVHWRNTGAAWSMFTGQNAILAIVALLALLVLFLSRHHFEVHTRIGRISMGLIFGGIVGNLIDRLFRDHVVDFVRFYMIRRNGDEIGFPAFNVADSGICIGVALLFLISFRPDVAQPAKPLPTSPGS